MSLLEKEWFIQAPWGRICVVAWGNCLDPPVLLCHGNIDSAASFRPLISLLPKNFYYVCMELPGNGKSDRFPPGMMINTYDMAYCIVVIVRHFRWENFIYIGHSLGACIGKIHAITFPNRISKLIELDPVTVDTVHEPGDFSRWYKRSYYEFAVNYDKYSQPKEEGPKYKFDVAVEKLVKNRRLTKEAAEATLARWTEPCGDGLIRFTFDQRLKLVSHLRIPADITEQLHTRVTTPTLALLAEESIASGYYKKTNFVFDEKAFPAGNYRVRVIPGHHDVHLVRPEVAAPYITNFLLFGLAGLDGVAKL
ncbi:serine hydrolase-like protein [Battus philenor]|uniref:serine hydrolase-like protein n=1 Tax=Battus philenor TaxID=42288 RepID=UPI0035CFF73C